MESQNKQMFEFGLTSKNIELNIPRENLLRCTIKESIFQVVPRFELVLKDNSNFTENIPIIDGDVLNIYMATNSDSKVFIKQDFLIGDYFIVPMNETETKTMLLSGFLDCKNLFFPHKNRSMNGNSKKVLSDIATEMGRELSDNKTLYGVSDSSFFDDVPKNVKDVIDDVRNVGEITPTDSMMWIQNSSNYDFINHIMNHAYLPKDTPFFYATVDGRFYYNSYYRAMNADPLYTAVFDIGASQTVYFDAKEANMMYYNYYDINVPNGDIKRNTGYGVDYYEYDNTGKTIKTNIFNDKTKNDYLNVNKKQTGVSRKMLLVDGGNTHSNFNRAYVQNNVIRNDMMGNCIALNIGSTCPVRLLDKILLKIPSNPDKSKINDIYSGEYIVTDIVHTVSFGGRYEKQIVVTNNGVNKSEFRKDYDIK